MHIQENQPLSALTTLEVGGPATELVEATSTEEIIDAVMGSGMPLLIVAGGSNLLIADDGFDGRAVHISSRGVSMHEDGDSVLVDVEAGHPWEELVAETVEAGLSGFECLSGIPGSTGATPVQNVGAYGEDVASSVVHVTVFDRQENKTTIFDASDCGFGYRKSRFKHVDRWVILSVRFRLTRSAQSVPIRYGELARKLDVSPGDCAPIGNVRKAVLALRAGKGMVLDPNDPDTNSAGSFFTNPVLSAHEFQAFQRRVPDLSPPAWIEDDGSVKTSAAWLIEHAGFSKGHVRGAARVSSKHTLAITNPGNATAADIAALARELRDGVRDHFGVELQPEPVCVGLKI